MECSLGADRGWGILVANKIVLCGTQFKLLPRRFPTIHLSELCDTTAELSNEVCHNVDGAQLDVTAVTFWFAINSINF